MPTIARCAIASVVLPILTLAGGAAAAAPVDPAVDARAAFAAAHPGTGFYMSQSRLTSVYGAAFSGGDSPEASADAFVKQNAAMYGVDAAELPPTSLLEDQRHTVGVWWQPESNSYKFTLVYYSQFKDGFPVYMADLRLLVRNEPGYPLVLARSALRDLRGFQVPPGAEKNTIDIQTAHLAAAAAHPGAGFVNFDPPSLVVWGGIDDRDAQPAALCWKFEADTGSVFNGNYQRWLFLVDALALNPDGTANIRYQEDRVEYTDVSGTVQGMGTANANAAVCSALSAIPIPYARVNIGATTVFANASGAFTVPNGGTAPVSITAALIGPAFSTFDPDGTPAATLTMSATPPGPANFMFNTGGAENTTAEVNAYRHANIDRDFVLQYHPGFPTIATQTGFPVNVMVAGTCNAFYSNSTINFFALGGGCNDTAFGTVVYHEFGHNVVEKAGSGQGGYGEGYGDCLAMAVTDDPITGIGFQTCGGGIRTANNTKQYPCAVNEEVHSCGTLLSGCVWSVRNQLIATDPSTYRDLQAAFTVNSVLLHSGTDINPQITIDWLTLDDNDSNIGNGTPHYAQINAGFSAHNMPAPPLDLLAFVYPSGRPSVINPAGGTSFTVQVQGVTGTPQPNTGTLSYNFIAGGGFTTIPMTQTSPNTYTATFPAIPCGSTVNYYVSAQTTASATVRDPDSPQNFLTVSATGSPSVAFSDDMEIDRGWTAGVPGDTATTGIWTRVDPVGTTAQPEDDHTASPGHMCFVTGQGAVGGADGDNDVDGGATTLMSPVLNLAGAGNAKISYWRWYSNDAGASPNADVFTVAVSNNNGSSWVTAETVGPTGPETHAGWFYHEFYLGSFVAPSATVRVRFVASDLGSGSLIEAAVDDFRVDLYSCTPQCPADYDHNGAVEPADIAAFVNAWFSSLQNHTLIGDWDGNGAVEPADIAAFVNAWFAALSSGC